MSTSLTHLIRRGSKLEDALREKRVEVSPPDAPSYLPPILTRQSFIVPRKDFLMPLDIDGTPLRARVKETNDPVFIHPEIRIVGVEDPDGGKRLATVLFNHYDDQIPTLRELIDGIFRKFVGNYPNAEELEAIASSDGSGYDQLRKQVLVELGVDIQWTLQPEPQIAAWLSKLAVATPCSRTIKYNTELAQTEFNLAFSLSVEKASLSNLHRLQRRFAAGLAPDKELDRLFQRVYEMTVPAFRAIWTGLNVWNTALVRELAVDGFAKVVADKLKREFGYKVSFSDFTPAPNAVAIQAVEMVSPHKLSSQSYEMAEALVVDLRQQRFETLKVTGGDFNKVKELDERIGLAEKELTAARNEHLSSNQTLTQVLDTAKPAMIEDLRQKFRTALTLENETDSASRYAGKE